MRYMQVIVRVIDDDEVVYEEERTAPRLGDRGSQAETLANAASIQPGEGGSVTKP